MKNVSLNIGSYGYSPPAQVPSQPPAFPIQEKKMYTVSFSAQFNEEAEAIKFAAELLNKVSGDAE